MDSHLAPPPDPLDALVNRDQMRLLLAIVEARSFSGAAAALGISQPAVSQQVKRIERAAGRTLFRRGAAGVELTADGEAVIVYVRAMLALAEDLRRHLRQNETPIRIAVGLSEDFCRTALPSVLWLFMRDHPQVQLRVVSGAFEMLSDAIARHSVDLAVTRRYALPRAATPFWSDETSWVGRADLPQPIPDPVPLVVPVAPSPARDSLFETLRAHRRTWRVAFESASLAGIEAALQAGLGVCGAPRSMPLTGVAQLDARSGLPPLPDAEFVLVEPEPGAGEAVLAFAEVLRQAAAWSFRGQELGDGQG